MPAPDDMTWQPSLLETGVEVDADTSFSSLRRIELDAHSWIDFVPGWVTGSDALFAELLERIPWGQRSRHMYDRTVEEPRLTWLWRPPTGPLEPEILERARRSLSERYEVELDSVGFNLYRSGSDSVAWHGDRITSEIEEPIVALLSLGEPRKFLLRPAEGGTSQGFMLGRGDLLVTGGRTQRAWQHSVPKVAKAGPRISVAFRHGLDRTIYDNAEATEP
jgi:alkylated DNA repair dioxygenase AlkB